MVWEKDECALDKSYNNDDGQMRMPHILQLESRGLVKILDMWWVGMDHSLFSGFGEWVDGRSCQGLGEPEGTSDQC